MSRRKALAPQLDLSALSIVVSEEEILADLLYPHAPEEITRIAERARLESPG